MTIVVSAGGDGRQLRPLTADTPKVLLPIGGRPLLSHVETWLWREGVREAVLTTGRDAQALREFAARPERQITFSVREERVPPDEAGWLAYFVDEEVLVVAGDELPGDLSLAALTCTAHERDAAAVVAVTADAQGTVAVAADGTVHTAACPPGFSPWRAGGAMWFSAHALARLTPGERIDMTVFLDRLIAAGERVVACPAAFTIVDTPEAYRRAAARYPYIAPNVSRGAGAVIDECSTVEEGATIGEGACVVGSAVGRGARIGEGAVLRNCVVGDEAEVGSGVHIGTDCVIGTGARVANGVTLSPGVRVGPGVSVRDDCLRVAPLRFRDDACPLSERPLDEWTAARLATVGAAIGNEAGGGGVLVAAEGDAAAKRLRALTAGLCEAGCRVWELGESFLAEAAGVACRLPVQRIVYFTASGLQLTDDHGRTLPDAVCRTVERRAAEEDVRRLPSHEWHSPRNAVPLRGLYRDRLLRLAAGIRPVSLTLCGDTAATERLGEVLRQIGCTRGDDMRLRLSDGGRRLAVYTPATGYLDAERVVELMTWVRGAPPERPDGLTLALALLRRLSETGESVAALNARLPAAVTVCRTAEVTPDTAAALQSLSGDQLDSEGVRISGERGTVTVHPLARGRLLAVRARAGDAEIARELCADMLRQLRANPPESP